jgi:aryl-alcohol dehydrogenase-like predicted oxidoreductase
MQAIDDSLRRLGTDYIDLYQIHRFDPLTNIEDTLRALDDLVRAGKVRYIGCSNLLAWQLMKALAVSREQHLERFRWTQSYYSLVGRDLEREMLPLIQDQGLGLLVWSPLAGGFLSGKFTRTGGDEAARRAKFDFPPVNKEKGFDVLDVLTTIAGRHGVSVAQIALAWILAKPVVTSVIIGARRLTQLDDNLKAIDVALTADDMKELDEVSKLTPEYPEWMNVLGTDRKPGERRY